MEELEVVAVRLSGAERIVEVQEPLLERQSGAVFPVRAGTLDFDDDVSCEELRGRGDVVWIVAAFAAPEVAVEVDEVEIVGRLYRVVGIGLLEPVRAGAVDHEFVAAREVLHARNEQRAFDERARGRGGRNPDGSACVEQRRLERRRLVAGRVFLVRLLPVRRIVPVMRSVAGRLPLVGGIVPNRLHRQQARRQRKRRQKSGNTQPRAITKGFRPPAFLRNHRFLHFLVPLLPRPLFMITTRAIKSDSSIPNPLRANVNCAQK